ncbi:MAG: YceI family protein [Polyangiaceae bacterium]
MNQLVRNATRWLMLGAIVSGGACAKKEPKPLRTEPWLAHPPASAAASEGSDAALPATRYTLTEQSLIRVEIPAKRGALRGTLTRVSGELSVVLTELSQSRGLVRVDLSSLSFEGSDADDAERRARAALELSETGATPSATFDLSELSDVSPTRLEPAPESDAGAPFTRRARLTAVGNLLLHGFRVVRRASLEAEFGFLGDRGVPSTLMIRSRAPFVVSLETHAIRALRPESGRKPKNGASSLADEVRVSVELYGRKVE